MRLRDLIARLNRPDASGSPIDVTALPDVEVLGVQEDSRLVKPGDLFIARQGVSSDGKTFLADAHRRGAVAAVSDEAVADAPLPVVVVSDAGEAASILAHASFGDPSKSLKVLGVTGTNGKTTTTYLIRHLLAKAGIKCGLIGTCEIDDGANIHVASMTTPGPVALAEMMATMRDNGCAAIAVEVSSHALHQGRVAGVQFAAAGFTNLTGDHLDYHKTMDDYAAAKGRLFMHLPSDAAGCVNCDDPWSERMLRHCPGRPVRFSVDGNCHVSGNPQWFASDIQIDAAGSRFRLVGPGGEAQVSMRLVGKHNIQNALCAAAMVGEAMGLNVSQIADGLGDATGAPGRLQPVLAGQPFAILVDYAHTDDALQNVLAALRPITSGKLRVLFGCGGDRDRSKRPRMAKVAEQLADVIYVTSDNPRTEDPQAIVDEIVTGLSEQAKGQTKVIVDRRTAIREAIADASVGDVVLLAGKGHENYQIVGTQKSHFDDVEEATSAVEALGSPRIAG